MLMDFHPDITIKYYTFTIKFARLEQTGDDIVNV